MLKRLWICLAVWPLFAWAQGNDQMTWLDNRFRVDPTIKQVSFMVKREEPSRPVILVAPDGSKYYSSRHPKNVSWYSEDDLDIISIDSPMAGPWQAIGRVSQDNRITLLSNLRLTADTLPQNLYQSEVLKFSAQLLQNEQPLTVRDFLERVKLRILFYPFIADEQVLPNNMLPEPTVIGDFADDGQDRDEKAGDGIFTLSLPVDVEPGKYRVVIKSMNGVFSRALEQEVLVYPKPFSATLIKSHNPQDPHQLVVLPQDDALVVGSLASYIQYSSPKNKQQIIQQRALPTENELSIALPNDDMTGKYAWSGWVYGTDRLHQRELIFPLVKSHFAAVKNIRAENHVVDQAAIEAEKQRQQILHDIEQQKQSREKTIRIMIMGNTAIIFFIVGSILGWRMFKKRRKEKQDELVLPS
ncbi:TIGR03503 family protein [Photobacterium leiognathi]|uniref:TIGR03503 family protein n=1 Tax=Photobacterium leiognathi TaxID=553611 RepID=UPI0027330B0E|nr:TIGR03503 family protein [Photobacterium leiognathi]